MINISLYSFVVYLMVGTILMFIIKKFNAMNKLFQGEFFENLFGCPLCLGVWVFSFASWTMGITLVDLYLIGNFITGCVASFIMYVFVTGWNVLFREFLVE